MQFKVQGSKFKDQGWFQVPGYWFLVTGFWFRVEANQRCHFNRHCEEARRSNLLITLKNRLLLLLKKQDRNDVKLYLLPLYPYFPYSFCLKSNR